MNLEIEYMVFKK